MSTKINTNEASSQIIYQLKQAQKDTICPGLYQYDSCQFFNKFQIICPYAHAIEEVRQFKKDRYHERISDYKQQQLENEALRKEIANINQNNSQNQFDASKLYSSDHIFNKDEKNPQSYIKIVIEQEQIQNPPSSPQYSIIAGFNTSIKQTLLNEMLNSTPLIKEKEQPPIKSIQNQIKKCATILFPQVESTSKQIITLIQTNILLKDEQNKNYDCQPKEHEQNYQQELHQSDIMQTWDQVYIYYMQWMDGRKKFMYRRQLMVNILERNLNIKNLFQDFMMNNKILNCSQMRNKLDIIIENK